MPDSPKKEKTPWPTKAVMEQIYEKHLWGGEGVDFFSGEGSHHPSIVNPYINAIVDFLRSHDYKLSVCDLGCGDFNIGQQLVKYTSSYIAIDIVDALIERNKKLFEFKHLEFLCLDIAKEHLPTADCAILRQVLQHLSNAEIKAITKKLSNYKYLILTEHIPSGDFIPNIDIVSGQGNRLKYNSGVDLLNEPFNMKVEKATILSDIPAGKNKGRIVTTLYKQY